MSIVYKYEIVPDARGLAKLTMPEQTSVLSVGTQTRRVDGEEGIFIWAEVDPHRKAMADYYFMVVTTGGEVKGRREFIGTVHLRNGLVFHVYQSKEGV